MDEDLPMIVWLAGNEPYFGQFCLDADAAMARLSIKRTRLTQISGRELRVGRTRIDRYIKPVYRIDDIEAYIKSTKSTATALKSSSTLAAAAELVESQTQALAEAITQVDAPGRQIRDIARELARDIAALGVETRSRLDSGAERVQGALHASGRAARAHAETSIEALGRVEAAVGALQLRMQLQSESVAALQATLEKALLVLAKPAPRNPWLAKPTGKKLRTETSSIAISERPPVLSPSLPEPQMQPQPRKLKYRCAKQHLPKKGQHG